MDELTVRACIATVDRLYGLADHEYDRSRSFTLNDLTLNLTKGSAIQVRDFISGMIDTWDMVFPPQPVAVILNESEDIESAVVQQMEQECF